MTLTVKYENDVVYFLEVYETLPATKQMDWIDREQKVKMWESDDDSPCSQPISELIHADWRSSVT